jgi:hypothetical protein
MENCVISVPSFSQDVGVAILKRTMLITWKIDKEEDISGEMSPDDSLSAS